VESVFVYRARVYWRSGAQTQDYGSGACVKQRRFPYPKTPAAAFNSLTRHISSKTTLPRFNSLPFNSTPTAQRLSPLLGH